MRANEELIRQIWHIAGPLCASEGMELVFVEYQPERDGLILRIYIDKPGGAALEDCAAVSRQLSDLLDVHLDSEHSYRLEVSSPGIDRPLGKPEDFDRFSGKGVRIKTKNPLNGRKNFSGMLLGFAEGNVRIQSDKNIIAIPYNEVLKARLSNHEGDNPC
jgi:ribosome maturation factor RimP